MADVLTLDDGPQQHEDDVDAPAEPIRVLVRVRPTADGSASVLQVDEGSGAVRLTRGRQNFDVRFDGVLGSGATQERVYEQHVRPAVDAALSGINSTVLAYGQTGAGKTHTLFGGLLPEQPPPASGGPGESALDGMAARALRQVFESAERAGARLAVSASFLEIYNETLSDLLTTVQKRGEVPTAPQPLVIKEDGNTGEVYVRGLTEVPVHSAEGAARLVRRALRCRSVRSTDMNARSSRSHGVLQLLLEQSAPDAGGHVLRARLSFVDLAGSERVSGGRALTLERQHQKEMSAINTSLSALASCIAALTQKSRTHVPYRDSLLTRLLQRSLGGNARTLLIAAVSPAASAVDESLSTLRFADRAKRVMLRVTVNPADASESLQQQRSRYEAHIARLQSEVGRLKAALAGRSAHDAAAFTADAQPQPPVPRRDGWTGGGGDAQSSRRMDSLEAENAELRAALKARDETLEEERRAHRRLQAALQDAIAGSQDIGAALAAAGLLPGGDVAGGGGGAVSPQLSPSRRHGGGLAGGGGVAGGSVADGDGGAEPPNDALLQLTLAELDEQRRHLDAIREEERQIELMLRGGGGIGGGGGGGGAGRAYRGRAPPPRPIPAFGVGDATGHVPASSPRMVERQMGWVGVGSGATAAAATARAHGIGRGGREYVAAADPHSRYYDARSDPNSKWYDPEFDPNSRWYRGGGAITAAAVPPRSGGGGASFGGGGGGGWLDATPPQSAMPRSAPAPRPNGKRGNNRKGGKGGKLGGGGGGGMSPRNGGDAGALGAAADALGGRADETGVGSLYYVLGTQATRSRVHQLQQALKQQAREREERERGLP